MIVADDPRNAAYVALDALEQDQTVEELAASFPSCASVIIPARRDLADAVDLRPDLAVTVVGTPYRLNHVFGRMSDLSEVVGIDQRDLDEGAEELSSADFVVLEALAAGPNGVLVDVDQARLMDLACGLGASLWIMSGVGRLLPKALFDEVCTRTLGAQGIDNAAQSDIESEFRELFEPVGRVRPRRAGGEVAFVSSDQIGAIVGPRGRAVPQIALRRSDCVAPAELIGFSRVSS
jgi:hypothetical protein